MPYSTLSPSQGLWTRPQTWESSPLESVEYNPTKIEEENTRVLVCFPLRREAQSEASKSPSTLSTLVYFRPETEFLNVIGTKDLRVFLLAIHSHLYIRILIPSLLSKSCLKLVCNVNIVYGNLKSENSRDYAQKPQRNYAFMNSASRGDSPNHCVNYLVNELLSFDGLSLSLDTEACLWMSSLSHWLT